MASTSTDRRFAISGNLGMKAPVRMGTTANITLSGLQTIDTVIGVAADRVLVKDQTDPIENGIWVQATGTWTRDLDFNGTKDAITGTAVIIAEGSQAGGVWKVATTGTINPGTSSITFSVSFASDSADIKNTPAGTVAAITTQGAVDELDGDIQGLKTYLAKDVAGAIDVTLSASEADNEGLEFTGILTGSINVIVPTSARERIFINSTTGAFTLTIKTLAGTGIAVVQGLGMSLYCDGTNVVDADSGKANIDLQGEVPELPAGAAAATTDSIMNQLGVWAVPPVVDEYVSAEQTITSSGSLVLPHGLVVSGAAALPKTITAELVCKVDDSGYVVGNVVPISTFWESTTAADNHGQSMVKDTTNITVYFGANAAVFVSLNTGTAAGATLTNTSWKLVIRASA